MSGDAVLSEIDQFDKKTLKHAETSEKVVLPDKETLNAEKTFEEYKHGIEDFDQSKLKPVEVQEKVVLPNEDIIAQEKSEVELRDEISKGINLKHVETLEKNVVPSQEVIEEEKRLSQAAS